MQFTIHDFDICFFFQLTCEWEKVKSDDLLTLTLTLGDDKFTATASNENAAKKVAAMQAMEKTKYRFKSKKLPGGITASEAFLSGGQNLNYFQYFTKHCKMLKFYTPTVFLGRLLNRTSHTQVNLKDFLSLC